MHVYSYTCILCVHLSSRFSHHLPDFSSFQPFISHNNFFPFLLKKQHIFMFVIITSSPLLFTMMLIFIHVCIVYMQNMNAIFISLFPFSSLNSKPAFRLYYDFVFLLTFQSTFFPGNFSSLAMSVHHSTSLVFFYFTHQVILISISGLTFFLFLL